MDYQAFTNDSLTMMYEAVRGAWRQPMLPMRPGQLARRSHD
jgi:hypothetical protein